MRTGPFNDKAPLTILFISIIIESRILTLDWVRKHKRMDGWGVSSHCGVSWSDYRHRDQITLGLVVAGGATSSTTLVSFMPSSSQHLTNAIYERDPRTPLIRAMQLKLGLTFWVLLSRSPASPLCLWALSYQWSWRRIIDPDSPCSRQAELPKRHRYSVDGKRINSGMWKKREVERKHEKIFSLFERH